MRSRSSAVASFIALGLATGVASTFGGGALGCSEDTDLSASFIEAGSAEAADVDNSPKIIATTLAPTLTNAPAVKASATWAALSLDDGEWKTLKPASEGTYAFPVPTAKWAIAFVCASGDDTRSTVSVHRRTLASKPLEVVLESYCTPDAPPTEFTITGNLLNVPTTTQWLEFGYARDSRGDAIPVAGTVVPYEEVGIAGGTWDFMFGIRDDSFGPMTRMIMRRGEVIAADKQIDVDVNGPGSFAPGTKPLVLRGIGAGDNVTPQILYGTGGPYGIALGTDDVPANQAEATLVYATVPEAQQIASDRYRGTLIAEQDRRTGGRTITFDIHQAMPLDLTFLPDALPPAVTVVSKSPQLRLETKFPVLANAVSHEVRAVAATNRRSEHVWHATFDVASVAGASELVDTMPELSALAGWKGDWNLPAGSDVTIFAIGLEGPQPLGDGTMQRRASKGVSITP